MNGQRLSGFPTCQMGKSVTVEVSIEAPDQSASYHLHLDLGRGIAPASAKGLMEVASSWFHEGGWPHAVMAVTVEGGMPTPTPTPPHPNAHPNAYPNAHPDPHSAAGPTPTPGRGGGEWRR